MVDAIMRLLPGVLGNEASNQFESFGRSESELAQTEDPEASPTPPRSTHGAGGLLDYPHYTRPVEFGGLVVPEILTGGDHLRISRWRRERALEKTLRNRPDLLERAELSERDREFLATLDRTLASD
jgi:tRNA (guanine37-N1)-methyltransferase